MALRTAFIRAFARPRLIGATSLHHACLPRILSYVGTIAVLFSMIGGFFVLVGYAFDWSAPFWVDKTRQRI